MMRPDAKVQKVYPYPKPVDFRKSIVSAPSAVGGVYGAVTLIVSAKALS
jgi:hypothetical protein